MIDTLYIAMLDKYGQIVTTVDGNIFYHLSTSDESDVLNAKSESVI